MVLFLLVSFMSFAELTTPQDSPTTEPQESSKFFAKYPLAAKCKDFINEDGNLGPWGKELIAAIERVGTDCFYESDVFNDTCPNFKSFSKEKKQQFLAYFWASISHTDPEYMSKTKDMRCSTQAVHQYPGGETRGLMFLEGHQNIRRMRGPHCKGSKEEVVNVGFQMRCSASMFSQMHCNGKKTAFKRSYWVSLRKGGAQDTAKKFPGCTK
ncbi:MAG: hypothetical protein IT287_03215 [Bdellovibrionaceae bacterium]|nr:hypothetical protein [Pseudobdellovibrionaceae bacterium]